MSHTPHRTAQPSDEQEFVCRGKEGGTVFLYDHPRGELGLHIVRLFVTGNPPRGPMLSLQEMIDWDRQPAHSYVADGHGALDVVAHPRYASKEAIRSLRGLAGIELTHAGDCGFVDRLWDELQRDRVRSGDTFLWGFGGDDSHSTDPERCGHSWIGIKVRSRNTHELKRSMREGAVYASNGIEIADISVDARTITVRCTEPVEIRWMRAGQFYDAWGAEVRHRYPEPVAEPPAGELARLASPDIGSAEGANRALQADGPVREATFALDDRDDTADPRHTPYVRFLALHAGDMDALRRAIASAASFDDLVAAGLSVRKAFSMPFRVLADGTLESPYPPDGQWVRGMTHNHADLYTARTAEAGAYHDAYRAKGIDASFETGYAYWFFPYLYWPPNATPRILGLSPDRCSAGDEVVADLAGAAIDTDAHVFVGDCEAGIVDASGEAGLRFRVPPDLRPGRYDVTVRDGRGTFQDTRPEALAVRRRGRGDQGWSRYATENGLPDEKAYMVQWLEGRLYVGTPNGLAVWDGEWNAECGVRNAELGMRDAECGPRNPEAMVCDREGNLWVSGWDGVYSRSPDGTWRRWEAADGLVGFGTGHASFHHIICTRSGELLLTHYRPGHISAFDGRRWRAEPVLTGVRHNAATFLAESPEGRVFAGSLRHGILERTPDGWAPADLPAPPTRSPRRIYFDPRGRMVLACTEDRSSDPGGICILEGEHWRQIGCRDGLPDARVWALAFGHSGVIYAATSCGVARIAPGRSTTVFDMMNSGLPHDYVSDLCLTPSGDLWAATGRGLGRLEGADIPCS